MLKDLLSDDRNKRAEEDSKVMSCFVSGRVVMLYLETREAKGEEIWRKIKSLVGSYAELSGTQFPITSLGCGLCLCGPKLCSGYYSGVRH